MVLRIPVQFDSDPDRRLLSWNNSLLQLIKMLLIKGCRPGHCEITIFILLKKAVGCPITSVSDPYLYHRTNKNIEKMLKCPTFIFKLQKRNTYLEFIPYLLIGSSPREVKNIDP